MSLDGMSVGVTYRRHSAQDGLDAAVALFLDGPASSCARMVWRSAGL